jgi:hypothetical protein
MWILVKRGVAKGVWFLRPYHVWRDFLFVVCFCFGRLHVQVLVDADGLQALDVSVSLLATWGILVLASCWSHSWSGDWGSGGLKGRR